MEEAEAVLGQEDPVEGSGCDLGGIVTDWSGYL